MTKSLNRTVLAGAFLIASTGMPAFGQNYPPQGYQYPEGYQSPQGYQDQYGGQQLGNLLAPIALYPDSLLSQVLVAATFPQQIADASQWLSQFGYLQGEARLEAARQQNWDASVQALVAFPDVLQRLAQDPQWTSELGNAFLNNQAAVMSAVQDLRVRAQQAGRLQSTPQQVVNVENYGGERVIDIVPTNPEVVYVPTYDPAYIWGAPAYGYYPSLYYPTYGFGFGSGIAIGAFFGGGYGGFGHWGWGSNWREHRVTYDRDFFSRNRFNSYRDGGRNFAGQRFSGQNYAGQNYGRQSFAGQSYGAQSYNRQNYNNAAIHRASKTSGGAITATTLSSRAFAPASPLLRARRVRCNRSSNTPGSSTRRLNTQLLKLGASSPRPNSSIPGPSTRPRRRVHSSPRRNNNTHGSSTAPHSGLSNRPLSSSIHGSNTVRPSVRSNPLRSTLNNGALAAETTAGATAAASFAIR